MTVSFQPSKDGKSLVLTPAGMAFIRQEELKIYNGKGDDIYKGSMIDQLYFRFGVEQGTYEKRGWRETNHGNDDKEVSKSSSSFGDIDIVHDLKMIGIIAIILFFVWLYQTVIHPIFNYFFN